MQKNVPEVKKEETATVAGIARRQRRRIGRDSRPRLTQRQNGRLLVLGRPHASGGVLRDRRRAAPYV